MVTATKFSCDQMVFLTPVMESLNRPHPFFTYRLILKEEIFTPALRCTSLVLAPLQINK